MDWRVFRAPGLRLAAPFLLVSMLLASAPMPAAADAINLTTSGTIGNLNEPDSTLYGVTNQSTDDTGVMNLGYIKLAPSQPSGPSWNSFDITLGFGQGLPSLEVTGHVIAVDPILDPPPRLHFGITGFIESITSSNPGLNSLLPPQFADLLKEPGNLQIYLGSPDPNTLQVPVYASFETLVPEPGSAVCFLAILAGSLALHRMGVRGRAGRPGAVGAGGPLA